MPPLHIEAVEPLLDRLAGICLSGGPDLDPAAYDERRHPKLGPVEPELDFFELEIARRADARGIPILAICRGLQALNVARGGTLHQHLPDRPGTTLEHRQSAAGDRVTHSVEITPGSRLHRVMRRRRARVNSFHHQAINRLGQRAAGRRLVARRGDRGHRGPRAPVRAGRAVARRDAHRRGPRTPRCSARWSRRRPPRAPGWRWRHERALGRLDARQRVHARRGGGVDAPQPARLVARPADRPRAAGAVRGAVGARDARDPPLGARAEHRRPPHGRRAWPPS